MLSASPLTFASRKDPALMTTSASGDALSPAGMQIAAVGDALPAPEVPRCWYAVQQHLGGEAQCFGGNHFGGRCQGQLADECCHLFGAHLQFPPPSSLLQEEHQAADADSRQNPMAQSLEDDQLLQQGLSRRFAELCSRSSYHASAGQHIKSEEVEARRCLTESGSSLRASVCILTAGHVIVKPGACIDETQLYISA